MVAVPVAAVVEVVVAPVAENPAYGNGFLRLPGGVRGRRASGLGSAPEWVLRKMLRSRPGPGEGVRGWTWTGSWRRGWTGRPHCRLRTWGRVRRLAGADEGARGKDGVIYPPSALCTSGRPRGRDEETEKEGQDGEVEKEGEGEGEGAGEGKRKGTGR